ncbi:MAG: hypothetical protein Ct9H300mP13_1140 [Gammaproteobacteria bacterium]|nr:MAG: hypothetical protein Ct9H300mP13_1140 [Gammaproteobacteria bacterium]
MIKNFRPGTLERWGLGYEDLRRLNPGLIMLRVSAYGQNGPKKRSAGLCPNRPGIRGTVLSCRTAGYASTHCWIDHVSRLSQWSLRCLRVLLALRAGDQNGGGQFIDIALHDGIFRFLDEIAAVYEKTRAGT